jgi:hypothetical protein
MRDAVQEAFEVGRLAWPGVHLAPERFRGHLKRVLGQAPSWDWQAHAAELYLVCACISGDAVAQAAFERAFYTDLEASIRRIDSEPALVDAAMASLRARLFARDGKLSAYAGRGALSAWLSVFAARVALDAVRARAARAVLGRDVS